MQSISVIVTAMNEEDNLRPGVESIQAALNTHFSNYEIIIVNDGSSDRTGDVANGLAALDPRVRAHHNKTNLGLHRAYLTGIEMASKSYICWVAGNNMITTQDLEGVFGAMAHADVVFSYPAVDKRPANRVFISRSVTLLLNTLFNVRLRHYTGPCVYPTSLAKRLRTVTKGSMIVPEIVLRLLKAGQSYVEVPLDPKPRTAGRTKTFRLKNVVAALSGVLSLYMDIQVRRNITLAAVSLRRVFSSGTEL